MPSAAEPPTRHNYPVLAVCGFLLLAVVLVFRQTVGFEFVNFDDFDYVYENPNVARGLSPAGIVWALTGTHSDNWHPLTSLSYLLDYECYGLASRGAIILPTSSCTAPPRSGYSWSCGE